MKNYIIKIWLLFTLLIASAYASAQVYVEGYGGVNAITVKYKHGFIGNFGLGYNNKSIRIGGEVGLGIGIPYKASDKPSGEGGGVTFGEYTEGDNYTTKSLPKKIAQSGNIEEKNNVMYFANQLTFGAIAEWFIIRTFTDKVKWFDIGLFSGVGCGYYHSDYAVKYFQPYVKGGLSLNFNAKDVTFFINGDIRYFAALNGPDYRTYIYHSYIQPVANFGIRYTIPVHKKVAEKSIEKEVVIVEKEAQVKETKSNETQNNEQDKQPNNTNSTITVNINNQSNNTESTKESIKDTVKVTSEIMLPSTIFFANDSYTIRQTEYRKLDDAAKFARKYNKSIKLIGMASRVGGSLHNQELSANRCKSVKRYLVAHGVNPYLINIEARGDSTSELFEEAIDRCVIIVFEN